MRDTDLVKCAQLDLLKELKRICKKNNLQYFLVGGTLIGAIRHNGFIPWDDDIDVAMMRDQYDKFIQVCKSDLDSAYELSDWYSDAATPIPFVKLKIKGSHYVEELAKNTGVNDEIFIDIFPQDAAPDNQFWQKVLWTKVYLIKKILLLRCGYSIDGNKNSIKKLLYSFLFHLSRIRSVEQWKKTYDKVTTSYCNDNSKYIISYGGVYSFSKERKPREMLLDFTEHIFEDDYFSIPAKYDEYLKSHYGDYMKLPPEEKRGGRHQISYINLGGYEVKSRIKEMVE